LMQLVTSFELSGQCAEVRKWSICRRLRTFLAIARDRGSLKGSAISPLLANLFTHYAGFE
jgi:hypothetical protein